MEQVLARIAQQDRMIAELRDVVFTTPRLHRKDLERLLGISASALTRRMKRRDFPRPVYDAGRPKWRPSDFGQISPG